MMQYTFKLTYTPDDPDSDKSREQVIVEGDSLKAAAEAGLQQLVKKLEPWNTDDEVRDALVEFDDVCLDLILNDDEAKNHVEWGWLGNDGAFYAVLHELPPVVTMRLT